MAAKERTTFPLWEGYSVEWDGSYNWCLNKEVTRKSKEGVEYQSVATVGYYESLAKAVVAILREQWAWMGDMITLQQVLDAVKEAEAKVEALVEEKVHAN